MIPFDLLLSIGSFILTLEMLPMVWNKKTAVPLWASLGTAAVLFPYFPIIFWLLGTPMMAIVLTAEGLLWWFIVLKRRTPSLKKVDGCVICGETDHEELGEPIKGSELYPVGSVGEWWQNWLKLGYKEQAYVCAECSAK